MGREALSLDQASSLLFLHLLTPMATAGDQGYINFDEHFAELAGDLQRWEF